MKKNLKNNLKINIVIILSLIFVAFFLNILIIAENTNLILDFINLSILSLILFFLFLNSNLNYLFVIVPTHYNAIRFLLTTKVIKRVIYGNII